MALLSDIDWVIILAVGVFLLFGRDSGQTLRTLGRWYGRAGKLKQELLAEFTKAADLPPPTPGAPLSLRGALLGLDPIPAQQSGIPTAVRTPPVVPPAPPPPPVPPTPWTGGAPVVTWTMTTPVVPGDLEVLR